MPQSVAQVVNVATVVKVMRAILILTLVVPPALAAPKLPACNSISEFVAHTPSPTPSDHFREFRIDRADLCQILDSYFVVTRDQWLHGYSHVAFGDRAGTATSEDGAVLKWMVRPGGLATIAFPNGEIVYLAKEAPR